MARGLWHLRGGGGTTSDELTATRDDVIAGKTAVTSDSDDEAVVGTIPDKVSDTKSVHSWQEQENNYFVDIPQGAYRRKDLNGAGGRVWVEKQRLLNDLGISSDKIAVGKKLAGLVGTYKGLGNATQQHVVQGVTFSSAALSNAGGNIPGNGGGTYTPQPWQQVHQCAGSYMTGNVVINPIPSNYVNISAGQVVFENGVFGPMVNHGWFKGLWNKRFVKEDIREMTSLSYKLALSGSVLSAEYTSNSDMCGIVIKGSINLTPFKRLQATMVHISNVPNTPITACLAVVDASTKETIVGKEGGSQEYDWWVTKTEKTYTLDISSVNKHAFIFVGTHYDGYASGNYHIKSIKLLP